MGKDATEAKHRANVIYTTQTWNRWNYIEMCMVKAFRNICLWAKCVCDTMCILNMHSMHPIFSVQNNIQFAEYWLDMYVRSHRFSTYIYFFFVCKLPICMESNKMHVRNEAKPNPTKRQLSMHFHITFTIIVRTHCDKHIRFDRHSSNEFVYMCVTVCKCMFLAICRSFEFLLMNMSISQHPNKQPSKQVSKQLIREQQPTRQSNVNPKVVQ